jgi:cell division protein FtsB
VPHLLNLIKRQQQAIETLEAANTDLAARLTALEGGTN